MKECPICFEEAEYLEDDHSNGKCCPECAEYFQGERDIHEDHLRKLEKEDMFYD